MIPEVKPPATGPFSVSEIWPVFWVFAISLLGGFASWARKVRSGHITMFSFMELFGELCVSALVGIVTYWGCHALGLSDWTTPAIVGITSHFGTRLLFIFESWLKKRGEGWLDKWFGIKDDDK